MSVETIARRYGSALADVVLKNGEIDTVKTELGVWSTLIDSNSGLNDVFANPTVAHARKEEILEGLISKTKPSKTTGNFLRVLLRNGRITEMQAINERFVSELEGRSNVVSADVLSARELPDSEKKDLRSKLEKVTGKTVKMNFQIDPELIGGVVTRIGSTVFDGSVRTKLDTLKEQLAGT